MIRLLGGLAVVVGGALLGIVYSRKVSRQERCLGQLIDSLRYMRSELKATAAPTTQLIGQLALNAGGEVREFYVNLLARLERLGDESFESLWLEAAADRESLPIGARQRQILGSLGAFMGKFSIEELDAALEAVIDRLGPELLSAREKTRDGNRLYPGLGLCGGFMIAAIFM
ncbi:MAG: stage III sporulation protein AB [Oscillospiraceae bacterium]|nr:stage III sporulation protein AB [Oscillospiraceae bacterium]